jgi:hypothetical protein
MEIVRPTSDDIQRGWVTMPDGIHAFITSARVKFDRSQNTFCKECDCYTLPITAIFENADGTVNPLNGR